MCAFVDCLTECVIYRLPVPRGAMALVEAAANIDIEDTDSEFWAAFAIFQASFQQQRMQQLCIIVKLEELGADRNHARHRSQTLFLADAALLVNVWFGQARGKFRGTRQHFRIFQTANSERTFR